MAEEKNDKGFKVIDRRGREEPPSPPPAERTDSAATAGQEPPSPPLSPPLKENPPSAATEGNLPPPAGVQSGKGDEREDASALGVPRFLDLVQTLQMGAMAGLGMLQGHDGKRSPVDLPAAKDAIDLLGILQEKTKGNLTKEEEEVLREGLYHLRMGYMAMINAPPAGRNKGGDQR
jgi:hypothetical protein